MTADAAFTFTHRLRVRWGECDRQGIVFNPHYMAYVDVALTEYWRAIGAAYPQAFLAQGVDTFMVAASQNFRDAASFDDKVDMALRVALIGTTSLVFRFELRRGEALLFDGQATYVLADPRTRQKRPLGDWLIRLIDGFEATPPPRKTGPAFSAPDNP